MTSATLKGRLQTKIVTFAIAGPIAFLFAFFDFCLSYITMFLALIIVGLLLEMVWGYVIEYESGWKTFLFAAIEFGFIIVLVRGFNLDILISGDVGTFWEGLTFYLTSWVVIQLFLVYMMPIWRPSWADRGSEVW